MMTILKQLWNDDTASVIAAEYLALAGIVALGGVAGLTAIRGATVQESQELAKSIQNMNQGYHIQGHGGCGANTDGGGANDTPSSCTTFPTP